MRRPIRSVRTGYAAVTKRDSCYHLANAFEMLCPAQSLTPKLKTAFSTLIVCVGCTGSLIWCIRSVRTERSDYSCRLMNVGTDQHVEAKNAEVGLLSSNSSSRESIIGPIKSLEWERTETLRRSDIYAFIYNVYEDKNGAVQIIIVSPVTGGPKSLAYHTFRQQCPSFLL